MKTLRLLPALLFFAVTAFGQTLTIGTTFGGSPNSSDSAIAPVRTDISLLPATANGTVSTVHVYWSSSGCSNAIKIKFLHRVGNTLTVYDDRGPFTSGSGDTTLTMSPAVNVRQGDLIGVARVQNCGNPGTLFGIVGTGYVAFGSDVTGSFDITSGSNQGAPLFLYGTGTATSSTAKIVPVVGSVTGGFGSNFKTDIQLLNPNLSGTLTGTLVYHPASTSGQPTDPSVPYSLPAGQVTTLTDFVGGLGITGIGSLDFVVPSGQNAPVTITRVYNDAGALGTSGFTEELIATSGTENHLMFQGATGFMIAPPDPAKARFNIGIRTLSQGATITATLKSSIGATIRTVTKTYQPNWFEQPSASALFDGATIPANAIIQISVSSGSAIIYGSTTDNTTNDPAIQVMTVSFAIA
jgi:hypothetical protein